MQYLCLVVLLGYSGLALSKWPGSERPEFRRYNGLEDLQRILLIACNESAVAALPQMVDACALAGTLARPTSLVLTVLPPAILESSASTAHNAGVSGGLNTMRPQSPTATSPPARQESLGLRHGRYLDSDACAQNVTNTTTSLKSLNRCCNVTGCQWYKSDSTAWSPPSTNWTLNCTVSKLTNSSLHALPSFCTFPLPADKVELKLVIHEHAKIDLSLAALFLQAWQSNVSFVELQGSWGSDGRLATVLQYADKLHKLNASSTQLTHLKSNTLQQLKSLNSLWLNDNKISLIDPDALDSLSELKELHLDNNKLGSGDSLKPRLFEKLARLQTLTLDKNGLTGLPSGLFQGVSNLTWLTLSNNSLKTLSADVLSSVSRLQKLTLSNIMLRSLPHGLFHGFSDLEEILLDQNDLISLPSELFAGQTKLKLVQLANNRIKKLPSDLFSSPSMLRFLSLNNNPIESLDGQPFGALAKLQALSLVGNNLAVVKEQHLRNLTSLLLLDLGTAPRLKQLTLPELSNLSQLWLRDTALSKLDLPYLASLTFLSVAMSKNLMHVHLPPDQRVKTADITGTALGFGRFDITALGYETLIARKMIQVKHVELVSIVKHCMQSIERQVLDISDNSMALVDAMNKVLREVVTTVLPDSSIVKRSRLPSGKSIRMVHVSLILLHGPLQCAPELSTRMVYYQDPDSGLYAIYPTPVVTFKCSCVAQHHAKRGKCVPNVPFLAQPGGVVTLVLTTLFVAALVLVCSGAIRRRLRHARHDLELHQELLEYAETEVLALKRVWEIEADDVKLVKRIDGGSEGAYGAVWCGDWDGMAVAVKVLRAGLLELDTSLADEFDREADFLMRARHANVVRFFGAGRMLDGAPFVVLELIARGSLCSLLHGNESSVVNTSLQCQLAADVAQGMTYIHSLGALHRDLKAGNVLVTEKWRAKVADFGSMSTLLAAGAGRGQRHGDTASTFSASTSLASARLSHMRCVRPGLLTTGVGTPLYMAPEVLRGDVYGEAADVWAFGVIVWELVERRVPDLLVEEGDDRSGPNILGRLLEALESGKRLQVAAEGPEWAQAMTKECMTADASRRPTFLALSKQLIAAAAHANRSDNDNAPGAAANE